MSAVSKLAPSLLLGVLGTPTMARVRLKAPPIGSVANIALFYYGSKDRAMQIPQEKGIPRKIELRQEKTLCRSLPKNHDSMTYTILRVP